MLVHTLVEDHSLKPFYFSTHVTVTSFEPFIAGST